MEHRGDRCRGGFEPARGCGDTRRAQRVHALGAASLEAEAGRVQAAAAERLARQSQVLHHRPQRLSAMAYRELLIIARLAESAAERLVKEQRIVAEPVRSARLIDDAAFHRSVIDA